MIGLQLQERDVPDRHTIRPHIPAGIVSAFSMQHAGIAQDNVPFPNVIKNIVDHIPAAAFINIEQFQKLFMNMRQSAVFVGMFLIDKMTVMKSRGSIRTNIFG